MSTGNMNQTDQTEPEAITLRIDELLRDRTYQIRSRLDRGTVARYASAYRSEAILPPVKVAKVGEVMILVDGFHRVAALMRNGSCLVGAIVLETEESEARWLAASANLTHGLPLKAREIREAFKVYIRARKHYLGKNRLKSYRQIAADLGGQCPHTTVRGWMQRFFPKVARRMGGDENFKGDGGLMELASPQQVFAGSAHNHLAQARAALNGVIDPELRGEVIHSLEGLLAEAKRGTFAHYMGADECSDF